MRVVYAEKVVVAAAVRQSALGMQPCTQPVRLLVKPSTLLRRSYSSCLCRFCECLFRYIGRKEEKKEENYRACLPAAQ